MLLRSAGACAVTLLATVVTAASKVTTGCWTSRVTARFNQNCDIAFLALVTQSIYLDGKRDFVSVPDFLQTYKVGDCTAEWKSDGRSVAFKDIMNAYFNFQKKCQSGYIYFDKGWLNMNIVSGSRKRRGIDSGEVTKPLSSLNLVPAVESDDVAITMRKHVKDMSIAARQADPGADDHGNSQGLSIRADPPHGPQTPVGDLVRVMHLAGFAFRIMRTTGIPAVQGAMQYTIGEASSNHMNNFMAAASRFSGNAVLRTGLAPDIGTVSNSIAVALHIGDAHYGLSWRTVLSHVDDGFFAGQLLREMVADFVRHGFHSGTYRVWQDGYFFFTMAIHGAAPRG